MADIAFLLIVFFMTTTIFASERGLKMVLPEKAKQLKIASENVMRILVSPQGQVLVETEDGTMQRYDIDKQGDLVRQQITSAIEKNKELSVAIKVSRLAPYSRMIDVLDEVKAAFKETGNEERISLVPLSEEEGGGE
ncbi:biopolymer transporter ExbD [candidate division WOR-3 bacterium]|nr:biopolymer transporter ExbD [candidate division WOR-3 bacterium]